ncbi:MAG: hypothetical protein KDC49_13495 [Saprospiraceae bacterium]|nr:hypothetical protein [Saprospiraceae bacterium]
MTLLEKCRAIYKGDILAGSIYLLVGSVLILFSIGLYAWASTPGLFMLGRGLFVFAVFAIGKGLFVVNIYYKRLEHYKKLNELENNDLKEELTYTIFRLKKKEVNRRRYIYTVVIGSIIGVVGIFLPSKSIIVGSAIPIVLYSAIEFVMGLLSEFRLWEYRRSMEKESITE